MTINKPLIIIFAVIATLCISRCFLVKLSMFDSFFTQQERGDRYLIRLEKMYPASIGYYKLYGSVKKENNVNDIYTVGQYRNEKNNKVVFVYIHQSPTEEQVGKKLLLNSLKKDMLGPHYIMRPQRSEISWIENSGTKYVVAKEGLLKLKMGKTETFSYINIANGYNPVTEYFMKALPPLIQEEADKNDFL